MRLYDSVPDSVRESIYNAVEDCIYRGVSLADFKRVVAQAWVEIHQERLTRASKEAQDFIKTPLAGGGA